jgi:cytochrome c-type biogenesis protein CcmH
MNPPLLAFWGIAAAMVVTCIGLILLPFWRGREHSPDRRREANIAIYRQRRAEIDREVAGGQRSAEDGESEKAELGARLLGDIDAGQAQNTAPPRSRPWLASVFCVVFVAAGSVVVYETLGDPRALALAGMPNITQMTTTLRARIQVDPGDLRARMLLARIEQKQGDYAGAAGNLAYINRNLSEKHPSLMEAEAESRLAAGETLSGRAGQLFQQVLTSRPDDIKALWYVGLKAAEAGHKKQAIAYWNRLLDQDISDDLREKVKDRRNALQGDLPSLAERRGAK